jgi:DNA-binding NtrC family response regulator
MSRTEFGSVVVIDDDKAYLHTVALMLRAIGFDKISTYENGYDAIESIEDTKPDLVISDWDMPILTGIDVLMCMRDDPDLCTVPFILNTGHLGQERWKEAIKCGVTEFLFKPFSFQDFKSSVLLALDLAEAESDLEEMDEKLAS